MSVGRSAFHVPLLLFLRGEGENGLFAIAAGEVICLDIEPSESVWTLWQALGQTHPRRPLERLGYLLTRGLFGGLGAGLLG